MTSLPQLTIVPAGAGSGKTHRIQVELTKRIKAGLAPEKIVAVTFTEAAAGELRGRIRAALVKEGMLNEALRLDQAYISTIHGFGLRLTTEFAFDGSISPAPRLLNEDEQSMLVSQSLARSEAAFEIMQKLRKYGYSDDINNEKSIEQVFRESVLRFLSTLRSIGIDSGADKLSPDIEKKICALYGETQLAAHLKEPLLAAVKALLTQFPDGIAHLCDLKPSAISSLQNDFRAMKRAEKGKPLDSEWNLWNQLTNLKSYKRIPKGYPSGYQDLVEEVIAAAQMLPHHPGPLQDALEHAGLLLLAVNECLSGYEQDKKARSLLDFTDMVASARRLLCENDAVLECLKGRVDCLVIDEFQDTNPLQFSLLWALTRQGVPTIIVGDLKQAIMGFQGADARLLKELCQQYSDNSTPLPGNWRTTKLLMEWINQVGTGLFGAAYSVLEPKAAFTSRLKSQLELVDAEKSLKNPVWASYLIGRLHTLLNDETQIVFDKRSGQYRRLKGGDIAILCPTKSRMKEYAKALRAVGIRCRMQQDEWFASRIVQLASYALASVADSEDLHAKLYLAVTEFGNQTIESALQTLIDKGDIADPDLHGKLEVLAAEQSILPVDQILSGIIDALDLYGRISTWEDGPQARANLLRLQEESREFSQANRETMACGGYYGSDIKTFLAWLKEKVKRDDGQPDASVLDEDAVQIVTWHSSKGREWPIVAVCGMDDDFAPRLPATRVAYEDFSDLGAILEKVRVDILPTFDSAVTKQKFLGELLADAEESATRLLYVALTRAREKLILEWPSYQEKTRTDRKNKSFWDLFTEKTGAQLAAGKMVIGGTAHDYYRIATDSEPWSLDVPQPSIKLSPIGRRAIASQPRPTMLTPEITAPSALEGSFVADSVSLRTIDYGSGIECTFTDLTPRERGNMLHRVFEVLSCHPERTALLPDVVGFRLEPEQTQSILKTVSAFDLWLVGEFSPQKVTAEMPVLSLDHNGTVIAGTADMLVETADALWIIDHKSDITDEKQERFLYYLPQLKGYAAAIAKARPEKSVKGIAINWVSYGQVSLLGL